MSHLTATVPARAVETDNVASKPSLPAKVLMGALPFIGVVLFAIDAVQVAGSHPADWRHVLFDSAVTNMIGWAGIGGAVAHLCFSKTTARSIGWSSSPFQFEVGVAALAMGVAGLMTAGQSVGFAWAVIIVNAIYLAGCGLGHIRDIVRRGNLATNNTTILFLDFVVPAFLIWAHHAWA